MTLNDSYLCLDCDEIYHGSRACPRCGSRANWPLGRWLNLSPSPEPDPARGEGLRAVPCGRPELQMEA